MKKTLVALAVLCGYVTATQAATTFLDLSQTATADGITYAVSEGTGTFTGTISEPGGGDLPHTAISFVLDITNLSSITTDTLLVNFNLQNDVSLYATTSGLRFGWVGSVWSDSPTLSYTDLSGNDSIITEGDSKYLTLTMIIANIANGGAGGNCGTQLYASTDAPLIGHTNLGSTRNTTLSDISVNTTYVESAMITTGWVDETTASEASASLATEFKNNLVPEPATASLSLLGLAALMIRRRR